MNLRVKKTLSLIGSTTPPSSKSQSIRGMIFALLANGETTLNNILHSDDTEDAIRVCKQLGAVIDLDNDKLIIHSHYLNSNVPSQTLLTGNSGITTHFILPLLGLRKNTHQPIIVDCGAQMRARPIHSLVNALRHLGMTIEYLEKDDMLPASISGKLLGGKTEVLGITSQYLSALLISLPLAPNDSEIIVHQLTERPYVDMTLQWLKERNIHYTQEQTADTDIFYIKGKQHYTPFNTSIPGDFSSASYLIAAAALTKGQVTLNGLNMEDAQGDKRLISILQNMGADITVTSDVMTIRGGKKLQGIHIDANDIPDLLPTLAVIGTIAEGETVITHASHARMKETDRIHSMTTGLSRLGAQVVELSDGMRIKPSKLYGTDVSGYDDHRTVMALSIAGLLAEGVTQISDAQAIHKTFPEFIPLMRTLGADFELCHE